jgi:hypothetical protein
VACNARYGLSIKDKTSSMYITITPLLLLALLSVPHPGYQP